MSTLPAAEYDTTTIVLLGAFNPRIFQPAWFVAQDLMAPEDSTDADLQIVNNDLCAFETAWCRIEVLADRMTVRSLAAPIVEILRDLIVGTFQLLAHTPIKRLGLNTSAHFALPSHASWNKFGHGLAPKDELWTPIMKRPGTRSLIIEGERPDDHQGHVQVRVEPSASMENSLFIETNDEYRQLDADSASWALSILQDDWDNYRQRAMKVREHLLTKALESA